MGCMSAYDLLSATPSLSVLKAAVDNAGLAYVLKNQEFEATIFAPTNDAIATCYQAGCMTANTILFHVTPMSYTAIELFKNGNPAKFTMANAGAATVTLIGGGHVTIAGAFNSAKVIVPNVAFCKGYVHVIDTVLNPALASPVRMVPPSPPISPSPPACAPSAYAMIASMPQLAGFKALIDRTNRTSFFQNPLLVATIFAPLDCTFGPKDSGSNEQFAVDTHVVLGKTINYPTPLAGSTFNALNGKEIKVLFDNTTTPTNLRLSMDGFTSFIDPAKTNVRGCLYVLHAVGTTFWQRTPLGK